MVDVGKLTAMLRQASPYEREHVFPNHLGKPTEFVAKHIATGNSPRGIVVTSDGRTAYVTNEGSDTLTIITLANGETRTIPVGHGPRKVAVQPEPGLARVSIQDFQFIPAIVTIHAGQSVLWSNNDGAPHAIRLEAEPGEDRADD